VNSEMKSGVFRDKNCTGLELITVYTTVSVSNGRSHVEN